MTPWLKAFAVLPEDPSSVPGSHSRRLSATRNSSSMAPNISGLQGHTHIPTCRHPHLQILKKSKSKDQEKQVQAGKMARQVKDLSSKQRGKEGLG